MPVWWWCLGVDGNGSVWWCSLVFGDGGGLVGLMVAVMGGGPKVVFGGDCYEFGIKKNFRICGSF